ncbi:MAG: trypsin-like peptidase domain-containing protein [Nitriliruptoraceae bacterium]
MTSRRPWAGILVAVVAAACVAPPAQPLVAPSAIEVEDRELPEIAADSTERRVQEVTVRVRSLGCEQFGLGSGFVLPGGIVVTNRHVVGQPREVTLNTWDGRSLSADVAGVATDSDLALLQLEDAGDVPVAELRPDPVRRGEEVFAVGYPGGGPARVSPGRVLGMVDGTVLGEPAEVIRVEVDIAQGNSGGPLVDREGLVVGVVFAIEVDAGIGLAVPVATLLERLENGSELVPPGAC